MDEDSSREVRDGTLRVRTSQDGSAHVIALAGELDLANADTLGAALEKAEQDSAARITIDMTELEFIDSTGIAMLVSAHRRLNAGEKRIWLVRSQSSAVQRVMSVTGLDEELPFLSR